MIKQQDKIKMYEQLLHLLQLNYAVTLNSGNVKKLLDNIDRWSYAHRCGNGEYAEAEQNKMIEAAFWKLCDLE